VLQNGYRWFSLGLAPLAGVGIRRDATLEERALHGIHEHLTMLFSFKGLRSYKPSSSRCGRNDFSFTRTVTPASSGLRLRWSASPRGEPDERADAPPARGAHRARRVVPGAVSRRSSRCTGQSAAVDPPATHTGTRSNQRDGARCLIATLTLQTGSSAEPSASSRRARLPEHRVSSSCCRPCRCSDDDAPVYASRVILFGQERERSGGPALRIPAKTRRPPLASSANLLEIDESGDFRAGACCRTTAMARRRV